MPKSTEYGTVNYGHNSSSSGSLHGELPKNRPEIKADLSESSPLISSPNHGDDEALRMSSARAYLTIATLTVLTLVGSMSTGVLNISIPKIQEELQLPKGFVLWPASIYSLACGCFLLLAGSIADFVGSRALNLSGTLILGISLGTAGLSQNGTQIIISRGFQGLGVSMCFPTAISIFSLSFPTGRIRSVGFAFLGLGQPLGFLLGLVLGGVFEELYGGWRSGFYLSGMIIILVTITNFGLLPKDRFKGKKFSVQRFSSEIDWLGVLISSASLGILSYIMGIVTEDVGLLKNPVNIELLVTSLMLIPIFIFWMYHRDKIGKRALIPNHMWKNIEFSSICITVMISWGVIESMDLFLSLFYQKIQHLSALQASIRFIPSAIVGITLSANVGFLVHKFHMGHLVLFCSIFCTGSPLLMALTDPSWSYWVGAFWASVLGPLACNVVFTVANLITTRAFPEANQALAGAVFNTIAQFGASMGIAGMALVNSATLKLHPGPSSPSPGHEEEFLMVGYRGVFWACTALMVVLCVVGGIGLRRCEKMQE